MTPPEPSEKFCTQSIMACSNDMRFTNRLPAGTSSEFPRQEKPNRRWAIVGISGFISRHLSNKLSNPILIRYPEDSGPLSNSRISGFIWEASERATRSASTSVFKTSTIWLEDRQFGKVDEDILFSFREPDSFSKRARDVRVNCGWP